MKVTPIGDRILVKQASQTKTSPSGIVLPETVDKKKSGFYEIIALGDGQAITALKLKVGQKVVAGKYSGEEVEMEDDKETEYKILYVGSEKSDCDVVALIN